MLIDIAVGHSARLTFIYSVRTLGAIYKTSYIFISCNDPVSMYVFKFLTYIGVGIG